MTENQHTISEFAKRIDAAVAGWKAKLRREQEAARSASSASGLGDSDALRRAAADLETDLAAIRSDFEREAARATTFETLAMSAIRKGDDRAGRDALVKQKESAERLHQLDADATVLRAMLAELASFSGQS
jgi:hypothetical protein